MVTVINTSYNALQVALQSIINNALKYFYHAFCKANIKKVIVTLYLTILNVHFAVFDHGIKI